MRDATQFEAACRPYVEGGGPMTKDALGLQSWRYFVEINSGCNLRCVLCACGNREGYEHVNGFMDMGLLGQVLDKIKTENPHATVLPYGNSEPFLHPHLAACIDAIKRRGLRCEMATNLNRIEGLEAVLRAGLDAMLISVSGFTQGVYGRAHRGGDIERVKQNMAVLSALRRSYPHTHVMVHYHMYRDTIGPEFDAMKAFAEGLGFQFIISWARAISMENTISFLRQREKERTGSVPPIPLGDDGQDWNTLLPPVTEEFVRSIERLSISPEQAVEMYAQWPVCDTCPVGDAFTFIRHDGQVSLCACLCDRRLLLGHYLAMTQDQLSAARRGHPICHECLRYRMNLYYHVVDGVKFNPR